MSALDRFPEIIRVDTEFNDQEVVCVVANEIKSARWLKYFSGGFPAAPPWRADALLVGYSIAAESAAFQQRLGWTLKNPWIDLFAEHRQCVNEIGSKSKPPSLLEALDHHGIPHISTQQKDSMRALVLRGGPFKTGEIEAVSQYCTEDVVPLLPLLQAECGRMTEKQIAQACVRGAFSYAIGTVEQNGIPVDVPILAELRSKWDSLLLSLIKEIDQDFRVYDDTTFKFDRFADYLGRHGITWPRTPKGRLKSDDDTFKSMAVCHPILNPLRELRATLSTMKHWRLAVDSDGRNRTPLKPFTTQTARCAPSNTESIFGTAVWLRGAIKADPGYAVAYCDYEQEEFGISAWLSNDRNMLDAYAAGDVYLDFAKRVKAIPECGTKTTHRQIRDQYKQCVLAVGYGQQAHGLAQRLGSTEARAQTLLDQHHELYPQFWDWSDRVLATMQLEGEFTTHTGWRISTTTNDWA